MRPPVIKLDGLDFQATGDLIMDDGGSLGEMKMQAIKGKMVSHTDHRQHEEGRLGMGQQRTRGPMTKIGTPNRDRALSRNDEHEV